MQEINNDYFQTAALLGDLEWKMSKFPDQIDELKAKLRVIDKEADFAQKSLNREQEKLKASTGAPGLMKTPEETPIEQPQVQ